jgi:peptidoglycan/xylan/chitin deacetylase (PgdA/CDA1 family)
MLLEALGLAGLSAGALAWGVRGKSSRLLGPSLWRGPSGRKALALTFDDGPSESTREILDLLAGNSARATFFQCGHHVRRLPGVALSVRHAGHEIGNHTDTHPALYFRGREFMDAEISRAQNAILQATGCAPRLFRPPFGARWFGLRDVLSAHNLTSVLWTVIARDWALQPSAIAERLLRHAAPGAVICLHDGRALLHNPDVRSTIEAMRRLLPVWRDQGYELVTVSELFSLTTPDALSTPSAAPAPR